MTVDQSALDELLARATAIEAKLDAGGVEAKEVELREELEGLRDDLFAIKAALDEPDDEDPELEPAADPAEPAPGVAVEVEQVQDGQVVDAEEVVEAELVNDFDDADAELGTVTPPGEETTEIAVAEGEEVKGWKPCSKCGSRDADEYDDDTARCEDCGNPLVSDGDDDDDDPVDDGELPKPMGTKSLLSQTELMRAQRVRV